MKNLVMFCLAISAYTLWLVSVAADVASTLQTDGVAITWTPVPYTMEYELWVNDEILQPVYGRSEGVFVDVPHGTNCFKMRRVDLQMRYSAFTEPVCVKTTDMMDIFIPFGDQYI